MKNYRQGTNAQTVHREEYRRPPFRFSMYFFYLRSRKT